MPFGLRTWMGPGNHVLDGDLDPHLIAPSHGDLDPRSPVGRGSFEGEKGVPL